MALQTKHIYEFGPFRLDPTEHLLFRDNQVVSLTPKVFDLLRVLVEHHGHVMRKEELMQAIWPDAIVEENNLTVSMSALRKALGESHTGHPYIETVPRRGYRFVAEVKEWLEEVEDLVLEKRAKARIVIEESEEPGEENKPQDEAPSFSKAASSAQPTSSITSSLVRWRRLRQPGLSHFLWRYTRSKPRVLVLSFTFLGLAIAGYYFKGRPLLAHTYYTKGRYYQSQRTGEGLAKAIDYFERAIEKDPHHALAYAGLAGCYNMFTPASGFSAQYTFSKAKTYAKQSLDLDDSLADAHFSLAVALWRGDLNWIEAENHFKRAIELDPKSLKAHQWYALFLLPQGRFDEALKQANDALELAPGSVVIRATIASIYYFMGEQDQAMTRCQEVLAQDPDNDQALGILKDTCLQMHRFNEALAICEKLQSLNPQLGLAALAQTYAAMGQREKALSKVQELEEASQPLHNWAAAKAVVAASLGEKDKAFAWLEDARKENEPWLLCLKVEPMLKGLRSDPRFADLVRRYGLTP